MLDKKLFDTTDDIAWCPGCGNFKILDAMKQVLSELDIKPHEVVIVSGIGQAAKLPHYVNANGFNGLHGRAMPPAQGIKMVNKNLKVIINAGDGDSYGEGGNHFLHSIRRNMDITQVVHDNQIYGLTKGQGSPTTARGQKTTMQLDGMMVNPLSPLTVAISLGATFVARTSAGDKEHMVETIKAAINHKGYALVDILQPCVVFNKVNTYKWYSDNTYKLDSSYDCTDKLEALKKSMEYENGIPLGIIYKKEGEPIYEEVHPVIKGDVALVDRQWRPTDLAPILDEFI